MWRAELLEVARVAGGAACDDAASDHSLQRARRLVAYLDDRDPLVAYAAMRALDQQPPPAQVISLLLAPEHPATSSGFRFQLLRRLLAKECAAAASDEDDDGQQPSPPLLAAVLRHIDALRSTTLALIRAPQVTPSQSSCVYELLSFVSEFADQLAASEVIDSSVDALAAALMDAFAGGDGTFAAQPTFVASAAVACLHSLLRLLRARPPVAGAPPPPLQRREWLRRLLRLVVPERSSLSRLALELLEQQQRLEAHVVVTRAPQEVFVSASSRFPFLQSWIAFASSAALALAENRAALLGDDFALVRAAPLRRPGRSDATTTGACSLPDRATLLAVLSEQDDVMVDVLHTLLQLTLEAEAARGSDRSRGGDDGSELQRYLGEQLDPDLLFADILQTLGHDHLVLLDLLVSSETTMLEYLLRYLRRLGANWAASRAVLCRPSTSDTSDTSSELLHRCPLDAVMAVLIRLRFEIDKQVAAEMFPYNPRPLLRRLLRIEELYDGV